MEIARGRSWESAAPPWRIVMVFIGVVVTSGCASDSMRDDWSLIDTRWLAEDIGGRGVVDRARSSLTFESETVVRGEGGCNRFSGPVELDGYEITFGALASTRRACPEALMDQESRFFKALADTRKFRLEKDQQWLVFLGEEAQPLLRFSRMTTHPPGGK